MWFNAWTKRQMLSRVSLVSSFSHPICHRRSLIYLPALEYLFQLRQSTLSSIPFQRSYNIACMTLVKPCWHHMLITISTWTWSLRCYRYLGHPAFFPHPILPTIPLPMGHDNQRQRDLLRDLEPVHRWWCSKHHFLKGWVHYPSSPSFSFYFGLIYIIISMIMPHTTLYHHTYTLVSAWSMPHTTSHHYAYTLMSAWSTPHTTSHHHTYTLMSAWSTHASLLVIMLMLISHFYLLS